MSDAAVKKGRGRPAKVSIEASRKNEVQIKLKALLLLNVKKMFSRQLRARYSFGLNFKDDYI